MHCAEAPADLGIIRDAYDGMSPVEFSARRLALWGEDAGRCWRTCAISTLPLDAELAAKAEGATVAHNPSSNLKLASGVAPVPELRERPG